MKEFRNFFSYNIVWSILFSCHGGESEDNDARSKDTEYEINP